MRLLWCPSSASVQRTCMWDFRSHSAASWKGGVPLVSLQHPPVRRGDSWGHIPAYFTVFAPFMALQTYFVPCVIGQKPSSGSILEQKMITHQEQLHNSFYCCKTWNPAGQSQQYQLWNLLSGSGSNSPNKNGDRVCFSLPVPHYETFPPSMYINIYPWDQLSLKRKEKVHYKTEGSGLSLPSACIVLPDLSQVWWSQNKKIHWKTWNEGSKEMPEQPGTKWAKNSTALRDTELLYLQGWVWFSSVTKNLTCLHWSKYL